MLCSKANSGRTCSASAAAEQNLAETVLDPSATARAVTRRAAVSQKAAVARGPSPTACSPSGSAPEVRDGVQGQQAEGLTCSKLCVMRSIVSVRPAERAASASWPEICLRLESASLLSRPLTLRWSAGSCWAPCLAAGGT